MAQNITLLGASYSDVPSVLLPKTGGGTASFTDVTATTAAASDVASGKIFFAADGTQTIGTASGGGSGSSWEYLTSAEYSVSTTSTSNATVGDITLDLSKYNNKNLMLWVHIRDKAGKRDGYYYGSDTIFFSYQLANNSTNSLSVRPVMTFTVNSSGAYSGTVTSYGVYAYSLTDN